MESSSSLLLAQGRGNRTSSLDFAADFLDIILERGYHVLWALPSAAEEHGSIPSMTTVLQSLISQALTLNPGIVSEGRNPVTTEHFKLATSIHEWMALLERCISSFPRLFLVIDINLIQLAVGHMENDPGFFSLRNFVEQLSDLVNNRLESGLKIVVISWRFDTVTSLDAKEIFDEAQIFTDMGKRMESLMRQPKFRSASRRRSQRFVEKIRSSIPSAEIAEP